MLMAQFLRTVCGIIGYMCAQCVKITCHSMETATGADALFLYKKSVLLWNASVLKLKNEGAERMIRISEQERPLPF